MSDDNKFKCGCSMESGCYCSPFKKVRNHKKVRRSERLYERAEKINKKKKEKKPSPHTQLRLF